MENMKHTKGEWTSHKDQFDNYKIVCDGFCLAGVRHESDAKLIASAPKLLEALIEAKNVGLFQGESGSRAIKKINNAIKDAT